VAISDAFTLSEKKLNPRVPIDLNGYITGEMLRHGSTEIDTESVIRQ
jgi:hypothetical protein